MTLTPKQEHFCQKYIETGNASEAYRQAYNADGMKPETVNRKAKELLDDGKITARIEALQAEHQERHKLTVDDLLDELETARQQALELNQCSAAITATMGKAKILGYDKQNVKVEGINYAEFPNQIELVAPKSLKDLFEAESDEQNEQ